jgi:hypothetical protein
MLPAFLSFYLGASDPDRVQGAPGGARGGRLGHGLVYTPTPLAGAGRVPSLTLAPMRLPLGSPLVTVFLTRHLYLLGPAAVFVFLAVTAALLAASTGLGIGLTRAAPRCPPRRGGLAAVAPSLLAVPVCCGTPLATVLGTSAVLPLLHLTPWLLAAITILLAIHLAALWRRCRRWATTGQRRPRGHATPATSECRPPRRGWSARRVLPGPSGTTLRPARSRRRRTRPPGRAGRRPRGGG